MTEMILCTLLEERVRITSTRKIYLFETDSRSAGQDTTVLTAARHILASTIPKRPVRSILLSSLLCQSLSYPPFCAKVLQLAILLSCLSTEVQFNFSYVAEKQRITSDVNTSGR